MTCYQYYPAQFLSISSDYGNKQKICYMIAFQQLRNVGRWLLQQIPSAEFFYVACLVHWKDVIHLAWRTFLKMEKVHCILLKQFFAVLSISSVLVIYPCIAYLVLWVLPIFKYLCNILLRESFFVETLTSSSSGADIVRVGKFKQLLAIQHIGIGRLKFILGCDWGISCKKIKCKLGTVLLRHAIFTRQFSVSWWLIWCHNAAIAFQSLPATQKPAFA